jgi:hypothetical protein
MNTPTITDDYVRDLVREADLDWHQGFDLDGDNRYAKLIWNTIALEEKRHAAKVAGLAARASVEAWPDSLKGGIRDVPEGGAA